MSKPSHKADEQEELEKTAAMMRIEIPIDLGLVMGFELVPRLTTREENKFRWQEFLADFKQMHIRDPRVEWKDDYILFKFGERAHAAL
ncbi:hypothetical protein E4U61_003072 [Claviceps capensis]|nr:hypothetical protein E4U61_003072 [Claviceps capensis]